MKSKFLVLPLIAAVSGLGAGAASAATLYATTVVDAYKPVLAGNERDNTANALGEADGAFYSLGVGGWAVFSFGEEFRSPGSVIEITWNSRQGHPESADIFGSKDGLSFTLLASVTNSVANNPFTFSGSWNFLKIQDTTTIVKGHDGFDIDSIAVAPVPLPAAGLLLGGALVGVGALRKARRKA